MIVDLQERKLIAAKQLLYHTAEKGVRSNSYRSNSSS